MARIFLPGSRLALLQELAGLMGGLTVQKERDEHPPFAVGGIVPTDWLTRQPLRHEPARGRTLHHATFDNPGFGLILSKSDRDALTIVLQRAADPGTVTSLSDIGVERTVRMYAHTTFCRADTSPGHTLAASPDSPGPGVLQVTHTRSTFDDGTTQLHDIAALVRCAQCQDTSTVALRMTP